MTGGTREHKFLEPEQQTLSDKRRLPSKSWRDHNKLERKEREKGAAPLQQEQGIGAYGSKYQPQPFEGEDDKWREWARVLRSGSGRIFRGALAEVVEGHRNEPATINDRALTTVRIDTGLVCNTCTEQYHVLIMLTRGRAQWLVLKAAELEALDAYRVLLRRYEPTSTVLKLVYLLATTFSGDFMDSLTYFGRRVTSSEHHAKETLSYLISIGVLIKCWKNGGFRDWSFINPAGTLQKRQNL